jgi:GDPmannose 4,6-dehydratase
MRPTEVQRLVGDSTKAKEVLGWEATTTLHDLATLMVRHDQRLLTPDS